MPLASPRLGKPEAEGVIGDKAESVREQFRSCLAAAISGGPQRQSAGRSKGRVVPPGVWGGPSARRASS